MQKRKAAITALAAATGIAATAGAALWATGAGAADHFDPPARVKPEAGEADPGADIADVYAFHEGSGASGRLTMLLTFAGASEPSATPSFACDAGVLYALHVDNDGDFQADRTFEFRLGADDVGNCFVKAGGLTGLVQGDLVARVGKVTTRGDVSLFAGLRDDPFFFDRQGFVETKSTGALKFVNDRDFFAGKNASVIAIELPLLAAQGAGTTMRVWATTARKGS